jgi:two-component sensor histidine kinase
VNAKCTINVSFKPTATGKRTAAVSIADNANPQSLGLTGTGTEVKLSPSAIVFPTQVVGTQSSAKVVTLTNVGTSALTISSISLTGANAGDFTQTHTCGSTLGAGASCTISVTFHPSAIGTRNADISISDNGGGSPQLVPLSGTGTVVKLVPTSLSFGSQKVGTTSAAKNVTMTNVSTTILTINGISLTGTNASDFTQTHTCGGTLGAGASCTISVTFHPSATGTRNADISISDNGGGSPQLVPLSGTGAVATSTSVASSLNPSTFGQSVTFTATVTSSGGTPTGTVTFKDGTSTLGTGTLSSGKAKFTTSTLSKGTHSITGVYGGSADFLSSTSPALTQTVN